MTVRGAWCAVGIVAAAGALYGLSSADGHGGGSVRPPSGGSRGGQPGGRPPSGGQPAHSAGGASRQPGKTPSNTSHSGNVSRQGGQSPYGNHNQQPAQGGNSGPYGKPSGNQHPGSRPPYSGNTNPGNPGNKPPNYNPGMGTVRPPSGNNDPRKPTNPYGGTTVNNNVYQQNNAAYANKNNVGSVGTPGYGNRNAYGNPYVNSLPPGARTVPVNGANYTYAGGNFYQPVYSGGSVTYVQTPPAQMNFTAGSTAPVSGPPPENPADAAAATLNVAQTLLSQNNPEATAAARETLTGLISNYPGTPAAQQAQQMLQGIR